jgi:SSS family solute:Na+ symporter
MGYALVTQLFPSLLAALWPSLRVTAAGAMSGILTGVAVVGGVTLSGTTAATLFPSWPPYITDINIGVLALFVNVVTMFAVSRFARQPAFTPQPA